MKRSVRPLFSILLLVVFALTLSCRILLRRGDGVGFIKFEKPELILQKKVSFNSTLLKYSAIDIGEEKAKHEIEELLEGNFDSRGRYRSFATWRRFNHHDVRARSSRGIPLMLRSPQFYRYWLDFRRALHEWARKKRYQPAIMDELAGLLKGRIDNGLVGSERRYGSCAVVGNSGILMQKEYGELIDRHEVVIRLNNARTEKYERNVGAKTNISFLAIFCIFVEGGKYYSLKRFVEETGKSLDEWGSAHDGSMFHYSSGMQAVMLAVGICDKVSIFGFGKSASARHHYHTNQKAELRLHDYEAEYDLYHDLVNNPQQYLSLRTRSSFLLLQFINDFSAVESFCFVGLIDWLSSSNFFIVVIVFGTTRCYGKQ
uniref:Sialyltransferase-like protein n=1 Tax=Salix viminalis TaxID=40686 RepID=A0A6N2MCF1_SALVM